MSLPERILTVMDGMVIDLKGMSDILNAEGERQHLDADILVSQISSLQGTLGYRVENTRPLLATIVWMPRSTKEYNNYNL